MDSRSPMREANKGKTPDTSPAFKVMCEGHPATYSSLSLLWVSAAMTDIQVAITLACCLMTELFEPLFVFEFYSPFYKSMPCINN